MDTLIAHIDQNLRRHRLLPRRCGIVVAVSGGLDSMVLLDVLHRLKPAWQWRLLVAHFDHRLRGAESRADARFVEQEAARHGLTVATGQWPDAARREARGTGLEMAARLARHGFLQRVAAENDLRAIALAHHADDQAELFFLRLFRGAGGEGLAGMQWSGAGIAAPPGRAPACLVRPLLDLRKDDLLRYAKRLRIPFREDSSNASLQHQRNRVRHRLLPLIKREFDPAVVQTVTRAMEVMGADAAYVRLAAERWLASRRRPSFVQLHPAVQRQCVRLQLARLGILLEFALVERLRLLPNRAMSAGPGLIISRDDSGRVTRLEADRPRAFEDSATVVKLGNGRGNSVFAGVELSWKTTRIRAGERRPPARAGREYFDAARVGNTVRLRHWRRGDRFQPIGMNHAVKLQDLFTNLKVPRSHRHELLVATTEREEIWWVEGLRIGQRFKVAPDTRRRLEWTWRREPGEPGPDPALAGR